MSQFAPVVPLTVARELQMKNELGEYHLLLAHDVAAQGDKYVEVYTRRYFDNAHVSPTIIMDNSVIELGHPVEKSMMKDALDIIRSAAVVLPDELLDSKGTLDKTKRALDNWGDLLNSHTKAMVVAQGHDEASWVSCLEELADMKGIGWIGVPKNLKEKLGVSRVKGVEYVKAIMPEGTRIHLLGFSGDLVDDVFSARLPGVDGIDSAVVCRLGMRDGRLLKMSEPDHSKRGDWWDNPGHANDLTIRNLQRMRKWIA